MDETVKPALTSLEGAKKPTDWNDVMGYCQDLVNRRGVVFGMQFLPGQWDGSEAAQALAALQKADAAFDSPPEDVPVL